MSTTPNLTPGLTPAQLNSADTTQWKQIIRQSLADTRVATPAFLVTPVDPVKQTVTVQIAIQERVRPRSGAAQWWDVPPIVNVPIVVPRGGGFSVTLPLQAGDEGLLVFCDTCFDNWWLNGQTSSPPAYQSSNTTEVSGTQRQFEVRRHHVHDCGFIPGMWSQPNVLTNYSTTALQIRNDDGTVIYEVSDTQLTLTSPFTELTGNVSVDAGATGSFSTPTGQTVTVQNGIIIDIS